MACRECNELLNPAVEKRRVDPAATGRKLRLADEHATRSLEWDSNPVSP
jgi:hypothetical protein